MKFKVNNTQARMKLAEVPKDAPFYAKIGTSFGVCGLFIRQSGFVFGISECGDSRLWDLRGSNEEIPVVDFRLVDSIEITLK